MNFIDKIKNQWNKKNIIVCLFSIAFFFLILLMGLSLSSSIMYFYMGLFGLIPIFLFAILGFTKKEDAILAGVILVMTLIIYLIFREDINIGFKIFTNQVKEKSEELTKYRYQFFDVEVTRSSYGYYLKRFIFIFGIIISTITYFFTKYIKGYLIGILVILNMFIRIYFGIYENNYLVIMILGFLLLYELINSCIIIDDEKVKTINKKKTALLLVLIVSCASISGLIIEKAYKPSENLTNFTETIRDNINSNVIIDDNFNNEANGQFTSQEETPDDKDDNKGESSTATSSRTSVPYLLIILVVVFSCIIVLPLIFWSIKKIKNKAQENKLKENNIDSLKKLFILSFEWLKIGGLISNNKGYLNYANKLEKYNPEYQNDYIKACNIYLKVVYSDYELDINDLEFMRVFYKNTKTIVWNSLSKKEKIKVRIKRCL